MALHLSLIVLQVGEVVLRPLKCGLVKSWICMKFYEQCQLNVSVLLAKSGIWLGNTCDSNLPRMVVTLSINYNLLQISETTETVL